MHIFLKRISYGHVTWHAYGRSHICLHLWQLKQIPKLVDLFVKHNWNVFVVDRKQFSKITNVRKHKHVWVVWATEVTPSVWLHVEYLMICILDAFHVNVAL